MSNMAPESAGEDAPLQKAIGGFDSSQGPPFPDLPTDATEMAFALANHVKDCEECKQLAADLWERNMLHVYGIKANSPYRGPVSQLAEESVSKAE